MEENRKRRKLSSNENEVETQSPEEEIAELKQKIINMEAKLKLNNKEKEDLARELELMQTKTECLCRMKKSDINEVRDDVIVEIFKHISHNELGQISRVCKRWNELTKSPVLWRKTNVELHWSHMSQNDIIQNFINFVPGSPISVNINFMDVSKWNQPLDFKELCVTLQRKCPDLIELSLFRSKLTNSRPSVVDLCTQFLPKLTSLALGGSEILDRPARVQCEGTSKIRVLDVFGLKSGIKHFNKSLFSRMPDLEELCLSDTGIKDDWFTSGISFLKGLKVLDIGGLGLSSTAFQVIKNHGFNLKELYLCDAKIYDTDLIFDVSTFPQLTTICVNCHDSVTCEGVVSLVQSCPSLQNIYVDRRLASSYQEHPFVVTNKCKLEIVKFVDCLQHYKKTKKFLATFSMKYFKDVIFKEMFEIRPGGLSFRR